MPSNVTCNVIEKFFDKRKSFESNLRSPKIHSTYLILCLYIYLFIAIIIKKSTSFIMYKSSQNTFYFMNYIQYSRTSIVMRLKMKYIAEKTQKTFLSLIIAQQKMLPSLPTAGTFTYMNCKIYNHCTWKKSVSFPSECQKNNNTKK